MLRLLSCSQPPLLSEMVRNIYEATNDTAFLEKHFEQLVKEHAYWATGPLQVTVVHEGKAYNLSRYWSHLYSPRPESYKWVPTYFLCKPTQLRTSTA